MQQIYFWLALEKSIESLDNEFVKAEEWLAMNEERQAHMQNG
jgi:hypothetical protein